MVSSIQSTDSSLPRLSRSFNQPLHPSTAGGFSFIGWRILAFIILWIAVGFVFLIFGKISYSPEGILLRLWPVGYWVITWQTIAGVVLALFLLVCAVLKPTQRLRFLLAWRHLPAAIVTLSVAAVLWYHYRSWSFVLPAAGITVIILLLCGKGMAAAIDGLLTRCAAHSGWAIALSAVVVVAIFAGNHFLFGGGPYGVDSNARYFHALILDSGRWYLPAQSEWEGFQKGIAVGFKDGRWFSQYLPGGILLNLLGLKIGSVSLVFALIAAGTVGMTYLCGRRLYGHSTGLLGAALLAVSPMFFLLSAIFMEHTPAAFFLMSAMWFGLRNLERPSAVNSMLLGGCLGYACITRPLTALAVAGPLLAVWLWMRIGQWRNRWIYWLMAFAGWCVPVGFLLFFNYKTYGNAFLTGYEIADPIQHHLGFYGANGHTPLQGLTYQIYHINSLSRWMFAWPVTSYFFIFLLFVVGRFSRKDLLLLLPFAGLLCAYFFYGYINIDLSPRFVLEAVPFLALLSARGVVEVVSYLRESSLRVPPRAARLSLLFLITFFSLHIPSGAGNRIMRFHRDFENGEHALAKLLAPYRVDPMATVFVKSLYSFRTLIDAAECQGGAEFICDPGPERRKAYMARHPGRHYYVVGHQPIK